MFSIERVSRRRNVNDALVGLVVDRKPDLEDVRAVDAYSRKSGVQLRGIIASSVGSATHGAAPAPASGDPKVSACSTASSDRRSDSTENRNTSTAPNRDRKWISVRGWRRDFCLRRRSCSCRPRSTPRDKREHDEREQERALHETLAPIEWPTCDVFVSVAGLLVHRARNIGFRFSK